MDTSSLIFGMIYGAIGTGYFVYGKKQHNGIALLAGFLLWGLPCLGMNGFLLFLLCAAAAVLPFFVQV